MGTSATEREYQHWFETNREELNRINGLRASKSEEALRLAAAFDKQREKFSRSAAHCIIPNQMLEWYSPMIVVSFYEIHDLDAVTVELDPSVSRLVEAIVENVMSHHRTGTPEQEAQSFHDVMSALADVLYSFHDRGKTEWVIGSLAAMRYVILVWLRSGPTLTRAVRTSTSIALAIDREVRPTPLHGRAVPNVGFRGRQTVP